MLSIRHTVTNDYRMLATPRHTTDTERQRDEQTDTQRINSVKAQKGK